MGQSREREVDGSKGGRQRKRWDIPGVIPLSRSGGLTNGRSCIVGCRYALGSGSGFGFAWVEDAGRGVVAALDVDVCAPVEEGTGTATATAWGGAALSAARECTCCAVEVTLRPGTATGGSLSCTRLLLEPVSRSGPRGMDEDIRRGCTRAGE